jgi:uncharacterized protein YbjT (DUF2867 family)
MTSHVNIQTAGSRKDHRPLILLTGATGYIGGRLLEDLEDAGYRVRCLVRRPEELQPRLGDEAEAVFADMLDEGTLVDAMEGGDIAFYLVHSMGLADDFEERDRAAATNFGNAARAVGVKRIIYLGGLGEGGVSASPHLRSRQEVGELLRASGVDVIEFRAAVVLGSGSLSFELIRALVERLPVMTTPTWVSVKTQPIGVTDLLRYLVAAVDHPVEGSRIYEIGGTDQMSYGDLMREYARQRGLKRLMIPVPVLSPKLSSHWLGLITPVYARVGRKLIESLRVPTIVQDDSALREFDIRPMGVSEAIARAIRNEDRDFASTRWNDALSASGEPRAWSGARFGSRLVDSRVSHVNVPPERAFQPIERIGGGSGWYYATWLWKVRGILDVFVGGVGLRRGRRDPDRLQVGDTVDWWRVEAIDPGHMLRLRAEMKVPGRAWLEFEVDPEGDGSRIRQTAIFDPVGLLGIAYWYASAPFHFFIFGGMIRQIKAEAEQGEDA